MQSKNNKKGGILFVPCHENIKMVCECVLHIHVSCGVCVEGR